MYLLRAFFSCFLCFFKLFFDSCFGFRNIAKVVSQVHAFQEVVYPYSPDQDLQAYLRRRIARFAMTDIHLLAADSDANFQQSSERQTRRIHDTLRRVKATFQWSLLCLILEMNFKSRTLPCVRLITLQCCGKVFAPLQTSSAFAALSQLHVSNDQTNSNVRQNYLK